MSTFWLASILLFTTHPAFNRYHTLFNNNVASIKTLTSYVYLNVL